VVLLINTTAYGAIRSLEWIARCSQASARLDHCNLAAGGLVVMSINSMTIDDRRTLKDIETFYNTQIEEMPMNVADVLESSAAAAPLPTTTDYYYNYYYYYDYYYNNYVYILSIARWFLRCTLLELVEFVLLRLTPRRDDVWLGTHCMDHSAACSTAVFVFLHRESFYSFSKRKFRVVKIRTSPVTQYDYYQRC